MTEHLHTVTWDGDKPTFHCAGDATSPCHNFPDCDCESSWTEEHDKKHPRVPHEDGCWILSWLDNIEVECTWEGGDGGEKRPAQHDAAIRTIWDGDQIMWDYADPELAVMTGAEVSNRSPLVAGYCPMGCGQTLFLAEGGYLTCSLIGCPAPNAASNLLADAETEHIVTLGSRDFTVRHPLRERLGDDLENCELHRYLADQTGPPGIPGRYRVPVDEYGIPTRWESL